MWCLFQQCHHLLVLLFQVIQTLLWEGIHGLLVMSTFLRCFFVDFRTLASYFEAEHRFECTFPLCGSRNLRCSTYTLLPSIKQHDKFQGQLSENLLMIYHWKGVLLCFSLFVLFSYLLLFQHGNEVWISIEAMRKTFMQSKSDHE